MIKFYTEEYCGETMYCCTYDGPGAIGVKAFTVLGLITAIKTEYPDLKFIFEEGILLSDEFEFWRPGEEHSYDFWCFDGAAIGCNPYESPEVVIMTYPTLNEVLADKAMADDILQYRGLSDLGTESIHYGDIAIYCGNVKHD